jgi:hypothetical protein
MDEVKEVDTDTRQGLRILADSTKLKGTEGVARRLNKARRVVHKLTTIRLKLSLTRCQWIKDRQSK